MLFRMSVNSDTDVKMFPYGTFIVLSLFCSLTTQHFVLDKPDHVEIEVTYSDSREGEKHRFLIILLRDF